ncbi:replication protein RepA [Azospirillum sp. BE72]|uniref:replication protein RepA n=1 Tax=Azospirillum sp. BE72 TaxID=2817776 RepID=UPI002855B9C7|nr:replication protein RepA [Azospirillum sp. BE72]MDR6775642.1 hypothetical protein [Azospirillum sp. BE72]
MKPDDNAPADLFGYRQPPRAVATGRPLGDATASRLAAATAEIVETAPSAADISFQHTVFCQVGLPYRKTAAREWERQQGRISLRLEAGAVLNPETEKFEELPLPYGEKPRLVLLHLNAEAMRTQSPVIEVENSLTAFVRSLSLNTGGRTIKTIKEQLACLAATNIRLGMIEDGRARQINTQVVGSFDLWFPRTHNQRVLWPSTIRLSDDYFHSLMMHAVPLDRRAVARLAGSAFALDLYAWLAQRLHKVPAGKPQLITWPALAAQFDQGYDRLRDFRARFNETMTRVLALYPAARTEPAPEGLWLRNSPPPVVATTMRGQRLLEVISSETPVHKSTGQRARGA